MAPWQFPQRSGKASRKATDSGDGRSCPWWHEVHVGFCLVLPPGAGRLACPPRPPRPWTLARSRSSIFCVAFAAGVGDVGQMDRGAIVVGAEDIVGAVAIGAARPYREPLLLQRLTVDAAEESLHCSLRGSRRSVCTWPSRRTGDLGSLTGKRLWASWPWHLAQLNNVPSPWAFFVAGLGVDALAQIDNLGRMAMGAELLDLGQLRAEAVLDGVRRVLLGGLADCRRGNRRNSRPF